MRKAIRSGATEFRYERGQQPLPKMGPWKEELAQLLAANERKPARDRPTLMRVFEELRAPCPLRPGCCPSMLARITRLENVVCVTFGKHFAEKLRMLNKAFAANHRTTVSMRRSSTDSGAAVDGPRLTVMKEDNVFRRFLIAAAPVALFSAQAIAADKSPVQFVPMPTYGFDLNVNAGFSHFTNPYNSFSGTDITGEARYWLTISNGGKVQIDISGASMDRDGDIRTHFDVAGHLLFGMGTTTYGIMGSTGTRNSWDRFATIAGEAAWPVMMFGGSQLVVQAGYTAELSDSDTSAYIHGVINTSLTSNVVFSGNLGFASTNDGESYVRYGAQLSMAFNSMLSGNLTWQAAHKTEGSYSRTDNRLTAGLTFRSPGGSTPFHDLNLDTGIISDFKY